MEFDNIDIEEGRQYAGCIYDWVEVRSNNTAITEKNGDKFCGVSGPSGPILSKGNKMSVVFHSDRVNEGTGFSATVTEGMISQTVLVMLFQSLSTVGLLLNSVSPLKSISIRQTFSVS